MDFMEMYAQKKMTAEQAASLVKSGDWVDYGWCVNTPVAVDAALAKRLPELENVNFRGHCQLCHGRGYHFGRTRCTHRICRSPGD